jgi:hypothetical protein
MRVSVESWKQVWCRSQERISFRTELLGQFGENEVRLRTRIGAEFQSGTLFQFSFALSDIMCPERAIII